MTDGESRISDADYASLVRELRRSGGILQRRPSGLRGAGQRANRAGTRERQGL
jgi:hypothetical protein